MPGDILGEPRNLKLDKRAGGTETLYDEMGNVIYSGPAQTPISSGPSRLPSTIAPGAEKPIDPPATSLNLTPINSKNDAVSNDHRVKIRVPRHYLSSLLTSELSEFGGILFPYTPQITLEHKADYTSQNPTHSNYTLQFYKTSYVSEITITGIFTVQNDYDAFIYLSTAHLLSALTKMRWGGKGGDPDSGAPPPVCRLDAYGAFMFKNVPVVISSFKHDLPGDVDFYTIKYGPHGEASVPTKATFTVNCKPAYSRQEILSTSVTKYLTDPATRQQGYL